MQGTSVKPGQAKLKKMWSPVYLFHPWWEGVRTSAIGWYHGFLWEKVKKGRQVQGNKIHVGKTMP
jgi:hypothetical protein